MKATRHSSASIDAAQALLEVACCIRPSDSVAIIHDGASDPQVLESFVNALGVNGSETLMWNCSAYWRTPANRVLPHADLIIDIAGQYLLHSAGLREALEGGSRYGCFPDLTTDFLLSHVRNPEHYRRLMTLSGSLAETLRRGRAIRLGPEPGSRLECDIGGVLIDDAGRPAVQSGDVTYLTGQVSLYPQPDTLSGTVAVNGLVSPIGRLRTPLIFEIERGILAGIQGGRDADALTEWLEDSEAPHVRNMAHLSIGVIPDLNLGDRTVLSERVFGAVVLGFGAQPPGLGIFPDLETKSPIHWDAIATDLSVAVDKRMIVSKGRAVDEMLASKIAHTDAQLN